MNEGYGFDPTSLSDKDLKDYLNYFETAASRDSAAVAGGQTGKGGSASASQNMLKRIKDEQTNRQTKQASDAQQQQLQALLGGGGGGGLGSGPQQPAFDQVAYEQDLQNSAANQRQSINDIYSNQQQGALQGLGERYDPLRKQSIEEAAVLGNLRSPAFQGTTLANIDNARSRDTSNIMAQLGVSRGQALGNLEQGLGQQIGQGRQFGANLAQQGNQFGQNLNFQRQNSLANLLQGNNQFGQTFGLQNRQFNANQAQQGFENDLNMQGLNEASRLGNMQANAQKKTGWDTFGNIVGGLGGLVGGIGGLAGGVGALKAGSAMGKLGAAGTGLANLPMGSKYNQPMGPEMQQFGPQNKNYYGGY